MKIIASPSFDIFPLSYSFHHIFSHTFTFKLPSLVANILFSNHILSIPYFVCRFILKDESKSTALLKIFTPHCFHLERTSLKHWPLSVLSLTSHQKRNDLCDRQLWKRKPNMLNTVPPILVCPGCYKKSTVDQLA